MRRWPPSPPRAPRTPWATPRWWWADGAEPRASATGPGAARVTSGRRRGTKVTGRNLTGRPFDPGRLRSGVAVRGLNSRHLAVREGMRDGFRLAQGRGTVIAMTPRHAPPGGGPQGDRAGGAA